VSLAVVTVVKTIKINYERERYALFCELEQHFLEMYSRGFIPLLATIWRDRLLFFLRNGVVAIGDDEEW